VWPGSGCLSHRRLPDFVLRITERCRISTAAYQELFHAVSGKFVARPAAGLTSTVSQEAPEEALGCRPIAPGLSGDINDLTILIPSP
jgi:hypothetical protein